VSLSDWLAAASAKPLPGPFHHFEGTLHHWGYLAVGGLLFVEDFGIPVPGETMLIAASLYAGAGHLNIWLVAAVGFAAAVLGDNVGYLIGRSGGRDLVLKFGKVVFITPERLDRAEAFFGRHGGKIVSIARFIEGLRQLNGIIAGIVEMPWRRFVAFNMLGAAVWVGLWCSLGYLAGDHVEVISRYITYVAIAAGVVFVAWLVWHLRRRRRKAKSS
jgi:membrane protein DedA with SNARE-associated domain